MKTICAGCRTAVLAVLLLASLAVRAADAPKPVDEYQLKAVFLYNFTKFVEWPASAFHSTNAPFVIGIVGEDPFGKTLDNTLRDEVVRNRPLRVVRFQHGEPVGSCHILFVARSEMNRLGDLSKTLGGQPTLLVSDIPEGVQRGSMVNLVVRDNLRMEINPAAAERANLRISSKLLGLARIVEPKP